MAGHPENRDAGRLSSWPTSAASRTAPPSPPTRSCPKKGSFPGLGLIVTRGFKHLLEIARQSVPQGYGNSYFWVKPERIVPLHLVREVTERLDFHGDGAHARSIWPRPKRPPRWFRDSGINCIGVCFLHAYARGEHEAAACATCSRRVHPRASVSDLV